MIVSSKPKALPEGCFEDALRPSGNALGLLEPAVLELTDRRTPDGRPVLCHAEPFLPGAHRPLLMIRLVKKVDRLPPPPGRCHSPRICRGGGRKVVTPEVVRGLCPTVVVR